MSSYVSATIRRLVENRAGRSCEYCLIHRDDTFFGCEVDHIISEKHGGLTNADNLAFACAVCNRAKGSDIASLLPGSHTLMRLFNPRIDRWAEHFQIDATSLLIVPRTDIGQVTSQLLGFNEIERLLERQSLAKIGHFPLARPRPK